MSVFEKSAVEKPAVEKPAVEKPFVPYVWQRRVITNAKNGDVQTQKTEAIFFGGNHSPDLPHGENVLNYLNTEKPSVIILEGMTFWNTASWKEKLAYLKQFEGLSLEECLNMPKVREKGAVYFYLLQNLKKFKNGEIQVVCGEGSMSQEIDVLSEEYEDGEILEFYLLREIEMFYRNLTNSADFKPENFQKEDLVDSISNYMRIVGHNFSVPENFDVKQFLSYLEWKYQKYQLNFQNYSFQTTKSLQSLMVPNADSKLPVSQIKEKLSKTRDQFLLQQVAEFQKFGKVMAFYGQNHIINIHEAQKQARLAKTA